MSIKEIAEKAGVSPSTVSRVLNNPNYHCSDEKLRDKIWKLAIAQNYVPNRSARQLKSGDQEESVFRIHILITRISDPFFVELLHVVQSGIHNQGCMLTHVFNQPLFSHPERLKNSQIEKGLARLDDEIGHDKKEGLIILGKCDERVVRRLKKEYQAVVMISRNPINETIDEVYADGKKIAEKAIAYLYEQGYRKMAYVGETADEARFDGYQQALAHYRLPFDDLYVIKTAPGAENGIRAYKKLALLDESPDAIYFANDITAIGMLRYLEHKKVNYYVPAVIASDDIEEASFTSPMLTTIHLPIDEMGMMAIQLLTDRLAKRHKSVVKCELAGTLVVRSSVHAL